MVLGLRLLVGEWPGVSVLSRVLQLLFTQGLLFLQSMEFVMEGLWASSSQFALDVCLLFLNDA